MKKFVSIWLVLCTLCFSLSAFAEMTVSVAMGEEEQSVMLASAAGMGNQFYMLYSDGRLVRLNTQSREETPLGQVVYSGTATAKSDYAEKLTDGNIAIELLAADDQTLYGINLVTGEAYQLLSQTGDYAPVLTVTTTLPELFPAENGKPMIDSLCLSGGKLCFSAMSQGASLGYQLLVCDLASGEVKQSALTDVSAITPYQDGTLLCKRFDMTTLGQEDAKTSYYVYHMDSDSAEALGDFQVEGELGGYGINGAHYDAQTDTLFYMMGSRVMAITLSTGESRVSAYTGEGILGGMLQISAFAPGYYLLSDQAGGYSLLTLDSEAVQSGALVVYGELGSEAHKSFAKNYPDIPVDVSTKYTSDLETLTQSMVSGTGAFDVLRLEMSYMPVDRLIEKGYCMDLTDYGDIQSRIAEMYPQFVQAVTFNGRLMAVPVGLTSYTYTVNEKLWTQELGLSLDELPKTLMELYDFIENWEYDYADDHSDISVIQGNQYKMMLFSMMLEDYMRYYQSQNTALAFDTELFKKLCRKVTGIDYSAIEPSSTDSQDFWTKNYLFGIYGITSMTQDAWQNDNKPLLLSLDDGMEPQIAGSLALLIINPKTTRLDSALKYVLNYLDNLPKTSDNINLYPGHNEPVENKQYEKKKAEIESKIGELTQTLSTAAQSDQAALKDQIDSQKAQLEAIEQNRYSVRQEDIDYYRNTVVPHLILTRLNVLYSTNQDSNKQISTLLNQYLEGAVELDQMVRDLDKRVKMMQLEGQ